MAFNRILLAAVSMLALAACATGPAYRAPVASAAAAGPFISAMGAALQSLAPVDDHWWRLYNDPVLDGLVTDALAANTGVRVAVARLDKARSLLRGTKVDRLPEVAGSAGAAYARASDSEIRPGQPRTDTSVNAGLAVAYEVDLFGRVSRWVEAARGDVGAADADLAAVRVGIAAETTRAYADAASSAAQIAIATRIVDLLGQSEKVTRRRAEVGLTTRLDTARIEALRFQRQAQIPVLAAQRDAALMRLAMLTGRAPADLPPSASARVDALALDHAIPVGDGAGLLARRPDVRAAERRLASATARIGVATADLYPRITLGGSLASSAGSIGSLVSGGPIGWLLGPLISWSFTDHARARARVAVAQADTREALATFDGTVLRSLQETETALSAYRNVIEQRRSLSSARDAAATAAKIVRAQQREGTADALTALDAERTFAEREAELSSVDGDLTARQIDLFRALGGGWS